MSNEKDGGQAFPCINPNYDGNWDKNGIIHGMTLRAYFAGQALAGLLSNPDMVASLAGAARERGVSPDDALSKACIESADNLIAQLAK